MFAKYLTYLNIREVLRRTDIERKELIRRTLYTYFATISNFFLIVFAVLKIFRNEYILAAALLMAAMVHVGVVASFSRLSNSNRLMVGVMWFFSILLLVLLVISSPTGHLGLWLFLFPPFSYVMLDIKDALWCNLFFLLCVALILFFPHLFNLPVDFEFSFKIRFFLSLNTVSGLSYLSEMLRHRYELSMLENQEKLVAEKNKMMHAMNIAENASRVKTDFLSNMSHELRTPLNHIIGFSELIGDDAIGSLNDIQKDYLQEVLSSSRLLLSLIDNALMVAKIHNRQMTISKTALDMEMLLRNTVSSNKQTVLQKNIRVDLKTNDLPDIMYADGALLKQAFYHLISNAVKYSRPNGHVVVSAGPANGDIRLPVEENGPLEKLEISFADDGQGLLEKDLQRIFKPFEQVESSISRKYAGTGMGLSLAREIIEIHNGMIWAESDGIDKGAVLRVVLPVEKSGG